MAIEINKEYPEFKVTHTLHQLVDRLNEHSDVVEENIDLLDSAIGGVIRIYHDSGFVQADSDFAITANNLTFSVDSGDITANAHNFTNNLTGDFTVLSDNVITLSADNKVANIILRSNGATFGALRDAGGELEILSGLFVAQTFDENGANFPKRITLPSTGEYAPETDNKTVHGAINELHTDLTLVMDSDVPRIGSLETLTTDLQSQITTLNNDISSVSDRVTTLEALNISTRLTNIETQIRTINDRLGLLGI